jgi:hypothetical protein
MGLTLLEDFVCALSGIVSQSSVRIPSRTFTISRSLRVPKAGPVRELNFEAFYSRQPDTHGILQTQEWQTTFRALFHNGAYTDDDLFDNFIQRLNTPFNIFRNVFIPAGIYHFDRHQFTYGSDLSKRYSYGFFERFGSYYNGTLNESRIRGNYRPTPKVSLAGVETWDRFRLGGKNYNVHIG